MSTTWQVNGMLWTWELGSRPIRWSVCYHVVSRSVVLCQWSFLKFVTLSKNRGYGSKKTVLISLRACKHGNFVKWSGVQEFSCLGTNQLQRNINQWNIKQVFTTSKFNKLPKSLQNLKYKTDKSFSTRFLTWYNNRHYRSPEHARDTSKSYLRLTYS